MVTVMVLLVPLQEKVWAQAVRQPRLSSKAASRKNHRPIWQR